MRERNRDKQRLEDIQNCISNVRQFINGVSFDAFVNDKMRYFAIMKNIEIIGEAANMLTRNFRMNHPELPWRMIVGMRNVLTHGYANVSDMKLWKTATEDLDSMYEIINRFLSDIDWNEWELGEDDYSEMLTKCQTPCEVLFLPKLFVFLKKLYICSRIAELNSKNKKRTCMELYHGSYTSVEKPRVLKGQYTKDFGTGFYESPSYLFESYKAGAVLA